MKLLGLSGPSWCTSIDTTLSTCVQYYASVRGSCGIDLYNLRQSVSMFSTWSGSGYHFSSLRLFKSWFEGF